MGERASIADQGENMAKRCTVCDTVNADDVRFCKGCGTPITSMPAQSAPAAEAGVACPACNHVNRAGTKFCAYCGTAIAAAAPAPAAAAPVAATPAPAPAPVVAAAPPPPPPPAAAQVAAAPTPAPTPASKPAPVPAAKPAAPAPVRSAADIQPSRTSGTMVLMLILGLVFVAGAASMLGWWGWNKYMSPSLRACRTRR
jgi:hypothetical protein